jgi:3-oxoacyl-[acyl-carrier-protein] synthase II
VSGNLPTGSVAVTGLGLCTPAGLTVAENWTTVCAGRSTARPDPALAGLPVNFSCRIPDFDATALLGRAVSWRLDRFVQIALVAARQAIAHAGLDPAGWDGDRVGVVVGNSLGGTDTFERQHRVLLAEGERMVSPLTIPAAMVNMVAGHLAIDCGARGPSLVTATACASGTTALGLARDLLLAGRCDVVVAGGTESAVTPSTMAALSRMGALSRRVDAPELACRPFDVERDGFVAAEAAGFLVLERTDHATARGAPVLAGLSGFGASSDAHHATAPDPSGVGVERAIRDALADAGLAPRDIAHINAHGTSTPLNDVTEARVIHRVFGDGPVVTSTKGVTGHPLAAAGAIEAAYVVLALRNGTVPPVANLTKQDPAIEIDLARDVPRRLPIAAALSTSLGFGGHNAALVFTAA